MNNKTKLIIGVSLPIVVILVVVIAVALPKMLFTPKYDFLYTVDSPCGNYYSDCSYPYKYGNGYFKWTPYNISDDKLVKETIPSLADVSIDQTVRDNLKLAYPPIYRYSVDTDTFKQISFSEASQLVLLGSGSAPDGTTVVNNYYNGSLVSEIFGGRSDRQGYYLKNGSFSKQITIQNAGQPYYYNSSFRLLGFRLLGWIK